MSREGRRRKSELFEKGRVWRHGMEPMSAEDEHDRASSRRPGETDYWQDALAFWREYPAEQFDGALKQQVHDCVRHISSTIDEWRAAVRGDAAAAINLALRMRMPAEINSRLDVTMTTLLATAFDNAAAASVMAHLLQRTPLDPIDRAGLSTSWRVHHIWCESRVRNARRRAEKDDRA